MRYHYYDVKLNDKHYHHDLYYYLNDNHGKPMCEQTQQVDIRAMPNNIQAFFM